MTVLSTLMSNTITQQEKQGSFWDTGMRRSVRVWLSAPIRVTGKDSRNQAFDEDTRTLAVNAHGALISLAAAVVPGQQIAVSKGATQQSRQCRVVNMRGDGTGKVHIGIEFLKPAPTFWQIDFPPDDWA